MTNILKQVKAILWKNILINKRTKEYLRQNISILILGILTIVVQRNESNNFITPLYLSIAIFGFSRAVGLNWISQKFSRQRQLQKIMGMKSISYGIGWIIYFLLNGFFVCLVMMILFYFGAITDTFVLEQGYGFIHIVILYLLYTVSITGFILVISAFFEDPKNAAQGIIFLQLFINFLYFFRLADGFQSNHTLTRLAGIFPQIAFTFGLSSIGFQPLQLAYTYEDGVVSLLIGSFVYYLLAFYLDQVIPNQFGMNKKPLFFLDCFKRKRSQLPEERQSLMSNSNNMDSQTQTSATYEQRVKRQSRPMIQMKDVVKKFDGKQIITGVTIKYYPNQIFCLLGHNGAGKSTTINLLTGILQSEGGSIMLQGMKYPQNIDEIRKNMGLCLQYNILYDQLTVAEHLRYFCILKGISDQLIEQEVASVISQCNLDAEKQKFAKNLSGGNKRKLSLANALIGKSKYIFLDQPSSGLDPNSRQSIWGILKAIRSPSRCIILTTHHLEQAQQLSQRIGIMSYGNLVIVGDSDFIKDTFNVGYHAIFNFAEGTPAETLEKVKKIVNNNINGARQNQQTAVNTLKYILPLNQISTFSKTFHQLEQICKISLRMSSLQDSFVKMGEQQMNEGVLEEIAELNLPKAQCKYQFTKQFMAVFLRKKMSTLRSLTGIVSILLPCLFVGFGLILACLIIKDSSPSDQAVKLYLISYFLVWSFIFNTSCYCGDLVLERQKKFKYLSHVMGLKRTPYWLANYTFDYIMFIAPFSFFIILVYAFGESAYFLRDVIQYIIPILILFGFSFIGYSYMFSFMFQKSNTAFRLFPFFNLIFFYSVPQIIIILNNQGFVARYIIPLVSPFMALSNAFLTSQINPFQQQSQYSLNYIFLVFVVQGVCYLTATLCIQNLRFRLKDRQNLIEEEMLPEQGQNIQPNMNQGGEIVVRNVYKKYSNGYMAISNNSFSVKQGQIFGLLGPNGAGKSTTFNIITAALSKTSGSVQLLGQQVTGGIMDIFTNVGVCPQYDSLYDNITTQEHLYYFSRLKGLSEEEISQTLDYYYKILSLTNYVKIRAGKLSGGNKRKLVVSMAMLANPKIMFFDQPSSGVDPISRRYLWKSFSLLAREQNSSMILTTHTMNQAESLCSRIGILIKGRFVAISSLEGLKEKYGKGYRALIKADPENHEQINSIVKNQFGAENVSQENIGQNDTIVYTINSKNFSYSKAFATFEDSLSEKKLIKSYKINESTLQQIFLLLSAMQPEPEEHTYKEPWQFCCWACGANGCQCL